MFKKIQRIHFVGIGGIGMSGIAQVLLNLGYKVSGSDVKKTQIIDALEKLGGVVYIGHKKENIQEADVVVISSAIKESNVEVLEAYQRQIPVIPRAAMLAELMRIKYGIAIAGAHGKTTVTSMVSTILAEGGLDPTIVIGGKLDSLGSNAKLGEGDFIVVEADESDGSFLELSPTVAVITSIDKEHLDYYKDIQEIKEVFLQFMNKVPFYGVAILCLDDEHIQSLIPQVKKRYLTYGLKVQADLLAEDIKFDGFYTEFKTIFRGELLGNVRIGTPGFHNVYNSLAAIAVGLELEIEFGIIKAAMGKFVNANRRFQLRGEVNDILIVDDYGHHPTEIEATLATIKNGWDRRIVVVFQPHRYSRTKTLLDDFTTAFYNSDILIITDIYPAGEKPIDGVDASNIFEGVKKHGHKEVIFIPDKNKVVKHLLNIIQPKDIVITLGAGDIWEVGEELLKKLK